MSDYIYKWLENALDYGITEKDFWEMTLAELDRFIESKKRVELVRAQERACYDYILADLIGKSIGRLYSSSTKLPEIAEAYPSLFDSKEVEDQKQKKRDELSALRFKQFANFHNRKINKEVAKFNE